MRSAQIKDINIPVNTLAKRMKINVPTIHSKVDSVCFDLTKNTVFIFVDKLESRIPDELVRALENFLEVKIVFAEKQNSIDLDALRKRLNGSFPYVSDAVIENNKVILKVSGEFGKDRLKTKMKNVRSILNDMLGTDVEVELDVQQQEIKQHVETRKTDNNEETAQNTVHSYTTPSKLPNKSGKVEVQGYVFEMKLRQGKRNTLLMYITDKIDSLLCMAFDKVANKLAAKISEGDRVLVSGNLTYDDSGEPILSVRQARKIKLTERSDTNHEKRVELHAHSKMSDLDSVLDMESYVKTASDWGWEAIALTDHGNVQGIPSFYDLCKKHRIKPIFGLEAYLVNDSDPLLINYDRDGLINEEQYVVVDIETTGLHPMTSEIIEIGAVRYKNGKTAEEFHSFIKPREKLSEFTQKLTGITQDMLSEAPDVEEVLPKFVEFVSDSVFVAHNAAFDYRFLRFWVDKTVDIKWSVAVLDTLGLSRVLLKLPSYSLDKIVAHLGLGPFKHHRALEDARITASVLRELLEMTQKKGLQRLKELDKLGKTSIVKQAKPYHATILVQTREGLKNLYKIVSDAHVKYFHGVPRIPRSILSRHRNGLLVGTACISGEIIQEILQGADDSEIEDKLAFYDYIEIMPLDLLPKKNDLGITRSRLKDIYRKLYKIGEKLSIPVVMTGDVHFLDPEDEKLRRVLQAPQSSREIEQPAAYLRTTEEMLNAAKEIFNDEKICKKIVIHFPKSIASSIKEIQPLEKKLHTPVIEGADDQIRNWTFQRAKELYGDPLPKIVEERLNRELKAIISHGFGVLYYIAKKMVDKSISDGYIVGSRGSVGSSLVAYLIGITEVNPLPPHYSCPDCKHTQFLIKNGYDSGFDLPPKQCPKCGSDLVRNGQDIPFETFLGLQGEKVPDIDLNFSGDYQEKAHKFIEKLFGREHVFRAGTINTIATRTAYGYVKAYEEKANRKLRRAESERLAKALTGVKRTTGQHPGGLMIIPNDHEVYDFTPIQYPANTKNSKVFTTHFEYESIHDDLVKIDALGHDNPTFLKILFNITGINPMDIPMDDPATLSIFSSVDALGIKADDLGMDVGTIGIPEFGTQFVRGMLMETRPKTFAELVRISGLSHGTDVWLNNARDWIRSKQATLSQVIACRDDIMNYLVKKGMDPAKAFRVMENVRKGKGLKEEEVTHLKELKVPEWFIQSCQKIKYLFPKAHAAAYVSMAFRIAYFKVHYPLAFYSAYFTLKGDEFDLEAALGGLEDAKRKLVALTSESENSRAKETTLEVMIEMFLRGFSFLPVNLFKSDASQFLIEDGKLRIPFNKLPSLGNNVAKSIVLARKQKPFSSLEDLSKRSKLNKSHIEMFKSMVELENIPDSEQISLF